MIGIVDYGVGNLFSLGCSLSSLGCEAQVSGEAAVLEKADKIILPGVGAFADAAARLERAGLASLLKSLVRQGKPLLGICLGMQLLFDESEEFGLHRGLGLIPGRVVPLQAALAKEGFAYKVPHIGWNPLHFCKPGHPLLKYSREGDQMYYVHSYYAETAPEYILASSEYGVQVSGIVQKGSVYGAQFHPEKSGDAGLALLRAFAEIS